MKDLEFLKKYEELLDKDYCNCNEMNCIDNNSPRRILNITKNQQKEIDRLHNIINELEKYIGQEWYCFDNESVEFEVAKNILDKLKELKESNNE